MNMSKKSPARLSLASLLAGLMFAGALSISHATGGRQVKPANHTPEPTGKLAFASERDGDYEIYSLNPDGSGLVRLTNHPAADREPVWSPDGSKLAFVSTRDGNAEIYVMNASGDANGFSLPARLTNHPASDLNPVWSPDGSKIAFVSNRNGNDEIYLMNANGSGQTNLTNNDFDDTEPAWSPDGAKLAFVSNREANEEIYTMDATGVGVANLSNNAASDRHPSWGGARIAFQSNRDGNDEIYAMNAADGGALVRLTTDNAFDTEPWLSSDGTRIAFQSTRDGGNFDVYVMSANGGNLTRLTFTGEDNDLEVSMQRQPAVASPPTAATVQFAVVNGFVTEGTPTATIEVTRTGDTSGAVAVDYAATSGSASERSDFSTAIGTLRFAAGETSRSFTISITDDAFAETDETINLTLGNATGASVSPLGNTTLTIRDNDAATAQANPIDGAEFFVRQHYLDFLNREPETEGFNSWVNLLRNCPAGDTRCDRIEVSAAFFRSQEYQLKGYFVIRLYAASFGRFPTYREFIRDTQRINGATPQEVFANLTAYTNEFVARAEFREIYDPLSNAAYVDRILQTANITLPNRAQLVNDLNAGTKTRAQVLREIVDSAAYFAKEYNFGFVASQYYGYLRREPDIGGFTNWLNYLNAHPNDYRTMVHGFVNSIEYRSRFGNP
jgi:TolB protein